MWRGFTHTGVKNYFPNRVNHGTLNGVDGIKYATGEILQTHWPRSKYTSAIQLVAHAKVHPSKQLNITAVNAVSMVPRHK
jgi:hypothetical protein